MTSALRGILVLAAHTFFYFYFFHIHIFVIALQDAAKPDRLGTRQEGVAAWGGGSTHRGVEQGF